MYVVFVFHLLIEFIHFHCHQLVGFQLKFLIIRNDAAVENSG